MFDGSSIAGWKAINESDMTLMPDPTTACIDPFFAASTLVDRSATFSSPTTGQPYNRDPRGIAKKAEAYLKSTGIGDTAYLRPGSRILRLRRRALQGRPVQHRLHRSTRSKLPINTDTAYEGGNLGHRVRTKGGYFPVPPVRLGAGHARRDARGHGAHGRRWSRSTTTKSPPPSTSSA